MKLNLTQACPVAASAVYFMPLNAAAVTAAGRADAAANAKVDSPVDIQPATAAVPLVIEPEACVNERQNGVLT